MARERSFEVGGLNIRINSEHTPREYARFWRDLHAMKWISVWGFDALMIGTVNVERENDLPIYLHGDFYRFLNIDPNDPWFDVNRRKPASEEDRSEINIPENLKPNFSMCPYILDLRRHRLYVISRSSEGVSAPIRRVHKLVESMSISRRITGRYGDVHVTMIQDRKHVEELLRWPVIQRLEILVERPNPDENDDERKAMRRLEGMGARSELRIWRKSADAKTIRVDEETRALASIAVDNGVVKVKGKNPQGQRDHASSESFPMHVAASYDRCLSPKMSIFFRLRSLNFAVRECSPSRG